MIVETPWNHAVLIIGGDGTVQESTLSGKEITTEAVNQLGFTGVAGVTFDFKIQKLRLWGLQTSRPIRLLVFGFDNTNSADGGSLAVLEDWPDKMHFARIGYEFPRSVQNIVYSSDSTNKFCTVDTSAKCPWLLYLDVLWRGNKFTAISQKPRFRYQYGGTQDDASSSFSLVSLNSGLPSPS